MVQTKIFVEVQRSQEHGKVSTESSRKSSEKGFSGLLVVGKYKAYYRNGWPTKPEIYHLLVFK